MTKPCAVIPIRTDMAPAVRRDMVGLAADLIHRSLVTADEIAGIAASIERWSGMIRHHPRISALLAEVALRLSRRARLGRTELDELATWMVQAASRLPQVGVIGGAS